MPVTSHQSLVTSHQSPVANQKSPSLSVSQSFNLISDLLNRHLIYAKISKCVAKIIAIERKL